MLSGRLRNRFIPEVFLACLVNELFLDIHDFGPLIIAGAFRDAQYATRKTVAKLIHMQ